MTEDILGIIPVRGGSKRIPRKNLLHIAGSPLVSHSIRHLKSAKCVSRVVVSTDDPEISEVSRHEGAEVIDRPHELATDGAPSESALIHVLDFLESAEGYHPGLVVFLQATSPVRRSYDIDFSIKQLEEENADSLFSACLNSKLLWGSGGQGPASLNHDFRERKREQEFGPQYRENGSIYVFRPDLLRRKANRIGGRISIYVMPEWASFQIDQPWEVRLVEWILGEQSRLEAEEG